MIKCCAHEIYRHYVVECRNKERDEEANITFTKDEEFALMLAKKMSNLLMLNKDKVMVNLLTNDND